MEAMRLDRFLTEADPTLTRKTAKELIRKGAVTVNGVPERKEGQHISEEDRVKVSGKEVTLPGVRYFVYHKPAGELSATRDSKTRTVMDSFPEPVRSVCFPVGRLDLDTTGLLLITNDGDFNHRLMSPKKHVGKTYRAEVSGRVSEEGKRKMEEGIEFSDFTSLPALLSTVSFDPETDTGIYELTVFEGKFHQVKRMFDAVGNPVKALSRVRIGGLTLPKELAPGEFREYSYEELYREIFGEEPQKGKLCP